MASDDSLITSGLEIALRMPRHDSILTLIDGSTSSTERQ